MQKKGEIVQEKYFFKKENCFFKKEKWFRPTTLRLARSFLRSFIPLALQSLIASLQVGKGY